MNIEVTRDNVTILEQSETPHENEYKITTCYFTFDEFTSSFQVKRAIFTILSTGEMYETDIINNQCDIPSEVLAHEYETVKLGVYGYNIGENEELLNRFSPSYAEFIVPTGSYKEGALSPEPITPSQYDLYSQALQEGLQEVDDKLDEVVETVDGKIEEVDSKLIEVDTTVNNKMTEVDNKIGEVDDKLDEVDGKIAEVDTAITETNNLDLDVSDKVDGDVTVTLTKKDASTKSVVISDGTSLQFMWQGTSLGIKTDNMSEYVFVDLQGVQGLKGDTGEPFRIKKTYSSIAEMNADFNNMEYGDYVMIASSVEIEDNAKLYTRGEREWIFITDFSGAQGIKGETGATPNIQIGTVTSGSVPSITRTGTNENPVLNFVLQPGEKGNKGDTGATGNGIASITKTSSTGLVDTYTITFTDGNTTTFNVENGNGIDHISLTSQSGATKVYTIYYTDGTTSEYTVQDGEVTQEVFDEEVERLKMVYNAMPKVSGEGTDLTLNNTAECPVYDIELSPSELEQETTTGKNIALPTWAEDFVTAVNDNTRAKLETKDSRNCLWYIPQAGYGDYPNKNFTLGTTFKENTQYTLSYDILKTSTNGRTISIHYTDGTTTINTSVAGLDTWYHQTITSTAGKTIDYITPYYTSGDTYIDIDTWQIEEGTTETSYEKPTYGASPNPQYPQEIHTVSGENSVEIQNKNLLDKSTIVAGDITGNYATIRLNTRQVLWLKAGTYTVSCNNLTAPFRYGIQVQKIGIPPLRTWPTMIYESSWKTDASITFTTTSDGWCTLMLSKENNATLTPNDVKNFNFQLEKGSTSSTYVPHKEQTYPISLGDLEYCKIGDYEDSFIKTSGKNVLPILDGQETFGGITCKIENGKITLSGTSTANYIWIKLTNGIEMMSGTPSPSNKPAWFSNQTITGETYSFSKIGTTKTFFYTTATERNILFNENQQTNTIDLSSETLSDILYYVGGSGTTINETFYLQAVKGNTPDTDFEPYGSGEWYLKKNIISEVFDGVNNAISSVGSSNNIYYAIVSRTNDTFKSPVNDEPPKSNYYIGGIPSVVAGRIYVATSKNLVMCDTGTSLTTKELWNAWLKEKYDNNNPVKIWYVAYNPTYTLLSDTLQTQLDNIQKAITYQDQTNVSQTNDDLPFVIKMSAIRDLSGIFELIQ